MATRLKPMITLEKLKFGILSEMLNVEAGNAIFHYDLELDTIMLLFVSRDVETVVFHTDDKHLALIYDPESYEVVGIQIEGFEKAFINQHVSIKDEWFISFTKQPADYGDVIHEYNSRKPRVARMIATEVGNQLWGDMGDRVPA